MYRVGEFTSGESEFIPSTVFAGTIVLRDPILAAASLVFHISVTTVPLTAGAHMILFNQAWHVMPPLFNAEIPLILSWTGIATGLFLLLRRTFLKHVRAVSSWKDYAAMTCVLAPLITGLIARLNPSHYEIIVLMHCISAHILLVAIGWTRLGHFVFFTTGRFPVPDILTVNRLW